MNKRIIYMHRAYELALKGWGKVSPNPMVGAVIVKAGKVIAQGWHPFCGGPHAEAMAIAKAGAKARGANLYVTLEPCSHFGRTPPCTQAIITAGIKRVFVGVLDPNARMNGTSIKLLRKAGIAVEAGFLKEELTRLNEAFNKYITTGMPFVSAKIAQTLDGKTATVSGESKWITSKESREYGRRLRFGFDAILVGINTVLNDDPALEASPKKRIKKVILDARLRTPAHAKIFERAAPEDVLIFTGSRSKKKLNATVIQAPCKDGMIDLTWVMKCLAQQDIAHILIEGGGRVIGNALKHELVDKMMIYTAPVIVGEGMGSVRGLNIKRLDQALRLKDTVVGRIGEDILMEGYL
ncbi:MAG: bifunctional diaminohydroxyphosphoribosylaminopyrimidine deaminase/5-amino-6-(5-phosphoribosylamino)uracil reductase RibD [Candidatus Omnitrophica bacterium]|nr:bifunctional diaminohydroxyphosphoribosylaminopyrimidine deaminase/5-amino-6-(5-phosphoribosylamino)uracil reductase RibD [Candidatus Omnitrophota bacterium]